MTDEHVEQLLQELRPLMEQIAWRYVYDTDKAHDLVQEHALAVWAMRQELDETRNARAYVIGRMHWLGRTAQGRQAAAYKAEAIEDADAPTALSTIAQGDEQSHLRDMAVRQAFDKLPSHLWVVAWLVHGEGFLVGETARRLGLPRLLAEQRLGEATRLLQSMLKGWG